MMEVQNIGLAFLPSLISIITIIIGYKLLKTKLLENNVSKIVDSIHESNRKTSRLSQICIDELTQYDSAFLKKKEIVEIYQKINLVYLDSLNTSSEVVTNLCLLKSVLESYERKFDETKYTEQIKVVKRFIIEILEEVIVYCNQVVSIPKSSSTIRKKIIHKDIEKFVTYSFFEKYKYFNLGVIKDDCSAHLLLFFQVLNKGSLLLSDAASDVVNFRKSILIYLFRHKLYAPISMKVLESNAFGMDFIEFRLIKIKKEIAYGSEKSREMITLYYKNVGQAILKFDESTISKFYGIDFVGKKVFFQNYDRFRKEEGNIFSIRFETKHLRSEFYKFQHDIKETIKL